MTTKIQIHMDWLSDGTAAEMDDWLDKNAPKELYRIHVAGMVLEIDDSEIATMFKLKFKC